MTLTLDLPDITIHYRWGGGWFHVPVHHFFPEDQRTLLVTLRGAWMSDRQAQFYDSFTLGYERTVIATVNDTFTLNAWATDLNLKRVTLLPDGNAELSKYLGVLVDSGSFGFGARAYPSEWEVYGNKITYLGDCRCR